MFVFNLLRLVMLGVGGIVGYLTYLVLGNGYEVYGFIVAWVVATLADLAYRSKDRNNEEHLRFFWPNEGGQLFFFPLWILGILPFLVFALIWAGII